MRASGKDQVFAFFRRISLDDADTAERFGQTPCNLAINLSTFTKERMQLFKNKSHPHTEHQEQGDRDGGQSPVEIKEKPSRDHSGGDAAAQLNESRADQIPHPFGITHDPSDEFPGLRRIEIT